jgi:hypothetical protein
LEEAGPCNETDITADLTRIYSTSSTDGEILKTHSFSQTISTSAEDYVGADGDFVHRAI